MRGPARPERAGNYGVPLALLLVSGVPRTLRGWWARVTTDDLKPEIPRAALVTLQATAVLLVLGRAGYGLEGRELLARHYEVLGWGPDAVFVVGGFELGLATALAAAISPTLLALTAVWKIGTELLYPLAGHPVWGQAPGRDPDRSRSSRWSPPPARRNWRPARSGTARGPC